MSVKPNRPKRQKANSRKRLKPSPAKVALALKCIINHYSKKNDFDKKLLAQLLDVKSETSNSDLISANDAAKQLSIAKKTLANHRVSGEADLPHVKIGSRVYYRQADIAAFIERNIRISTSDMGGAK
jgi:hypothetical protein